MARPFNVAKPCPECPFTRGEKAARVTPGRARELATNMLNPSGATFHCHKTVDYGAIEENDGEALAGTRKSLHCAGALIFAEKNGSATQMMRIAERLGLYDYEKVLGDADTQDSVFDTKQEMVEACRNYG